MKHKKKKTKAAELPGSKVKMSFSKHVLPPLIGIGSMLIVLGFFNSQYIAAQIFALTYKPAVAQNDLPKTPVDPNSPSKIVINNIAVEAPIIFGQTEANESKFQLALRDGVVHYPNTAVPGTIGNVVIFGHSSGQVWAPGNYKFIFSRLEKLAERDKIYIEYQGVRYTYSVTNIKVVPPYDISVLNQTSDHRLTLITCTPVGTSKNRLIITAEQVAPVPNAILPTDTPTQLTEINRLPDSKSPSVWESFKALFD